MTPFRRSRATAADRQTALDYPMLVAMLNATQTNRAAFVPSDGGGDGAPEPNEGCFMELIEGGSAWRRAILGQAGSFNRDIAERDLDLPA